MLRMSTSRGRTLSAYGGLPDPPLASVLEQCYWGENNEDYFYINKYNDRRLQETPRSGSCSENKSLRKQRPSTAPVRHFSSSGISVSGERMPHNSRYAFDENSDAASNGSRCSTPDFMKEIYDTYSQLTSQNFLLRRPVSSQESVVDLDMRNSNVTFENENLPQRESLNQDISLKQTHTSTNTDELVSNEPSFEAPRKTVKVAINIPLCKPNALSENEADDDIVKGNPPIATANHVTVDDLMLVNIKDEIQSPKEFLSFSRPKTTGKTKRRARSAKKRTVIKTKALVTTVTVDYDQDGSSSKDSKNTPKKSQRSDNTSWKRTHEDIVTQMSRLDLRALNDEHSNISRQKRCSSSPLQRPKASRSREKKFLKPISNADNNTVKCNGRKIPIQIISDPFKSVSVRTSTCNGTGRPKVVRPFSASPYVSMQQRR